MKHFVTLASVVLLSCALLIAPSAAWAEDLTISPTSYDYGEVELGASSATTFDLTSLGPTAVWVYVVQISADGTATEICGEDGVVCDYDITYVSDPLPLEMPEGMTVQVEVTYTPTSVGESSAYLFVQSNDSIDPPGPQAFIPLSGTGVEPSPDDAGALMDDLLELFDASVDAGELWGIGPGRSAPHRLDAFRAMLETADFLIDHGADAWACVALAAARAKADGASRPPDFVAGPGTADVVAAIDAVSDALGCGEIDDDGGHRGCHH